MKNAILISSLIFTFFLNGKGQTEPLIQKYSRSTNNGLGNDFWTTAERENVYDLNNNLIFRELKGYSSPNEILYWQGGFYDYDNNNLLTKYTSRRYNPDVDLWITRSWIDYKYDPNDCLIEKTTTYNVGGIITGRVTYTRNEKCQITSEYTEWLGSGIELTPKDLFVREYLADGNSFDEYFYRQSFLGDTLYLTSFRKYIFAENKNTLEFYQIVYTEEQDTSFQSKVFYEYDENENVTLSTTYLKDENTNGWQLLRQRFYNNEYDENGFLIRKETEQWDYDDPNSPQENLFFRQTFEYKNTCEGINEEYINHYSSSGEDVKYEFVYQGVNECIDLEKMDLYISISPNPSHGEIQIESPIFKTGNTNILVFSTNGKVLLEKNEISRCESSFIDLTLMPNGIYILQLQNGNHFVNEKIVIAN